VRRQRSAGDLAEVVDAVDQLLAAGEGAAERVGVTAEELRGGVDHEVGAERERLLVDRRRERVVDDHDRAALVRGRRQRLDVDHLQRRVGRRLQVQHVATAGDRLLDRLVVLRVAEVDVDLLARQDVDEDLVRAAVGVLHGDDARARAEQREQRAGDGRHAGGEADRVLGVLEVGDLPLERAHRRVRVARVDVAVGAAERDVEPRVDVVVAEGDRVLHRHLGAAVRERGVLAAPDDAGVEVIHPETIEAHPVAPRRPCDRRYCGRRRTQEDRWRPSRSPAWPTARPRTTPCSTVSARRTWRSCQVGCWRRSTG
jgi:hypothetical protein